MDCPKKSGERQIGWYSNSHFWKLMQKNKRKRNKCIYTNFTLIWCLYLKHFLMKLTHMKRVIWCLDSSFSSLSTWGTGLCVAGRHFSVFHCQSHSVSEQLEGQRVRFFHNHSPHAGWTWWRLHSCYHNIKNKSEQMQRIKDKREGCLLWFKRQIIVT